jgi:hypothetical protein
MLTYVEKIAQSLSLKYKFDIWENDDIHQEVYLLIEEAEGLFDKSKGDEFRFYYNYVKNRLINFRRDNYGTNKYRMGIADAVSLEGDVIDEVNVFLDSYKKIINERVDSSFRADYLRYCEGVKIPHKRKVLVLNHIKEIIERAKKNEEVVYGDEI